MRRPAMRLKRADLPTFGRPTMAIIPGTRRRWFSFEWQSNAKGAAAGGRQPRMRRFVGKGPVAVKQVQSENLFMRMLIRWAFYTIGLPNLISFVFATGLGVLLSGVIPPSKRSTLLALVDFSSGLTSVFAGIILARLAGFEPNIMLPMVSGVWLAIHFSPKNKMSEFYLATAGVAA